MEHKRKAYEEEEAETKAVVAEVITACYPTAARLELATPRTSCSDPTSRILSLHKFHVLDLTRIEFDIQVGMKAAGRVTREPSRKLISCRTDLV